MSNPYSNDNPWQNQPYAGGPRYGNAYESEPIPSNFTSGNAYDQQPYSATGYNNTWNTEGSNKTEQPPQTPFTVAQQDAYQFAGTRYGNTYAPASSTTSPPYAADSYPMKTATNNKNTSVVPDTTYASQAYIEGTNELYHTPNKWRFWFRFGILLASIGHLGFAAGARPYSGENIPFDTPAVMYYLYVVAILSIIWSLYHIFHYCYRRATKKPKTNRVIMIATDLFLAVLWGIGVIIAAAKFKCPPGSKFCNFYNTSLFWGYLAFVGYIFAVIWDLYGACSHKRTNVRK